MFAIHRESNERLPSFHFSSIGCRCKNSIYDCRLAQSGRRTGFFRWVFGPSRTATCLNHVWQVFLIYSMSSGISHSSASWLEGLYAAKVPFRNDPWQTQQHSAYATLYKPCKSIHADAAGQICILHQGELSDTSSKYTKAYHFYEKYAISLMNIILM